ncbi:MAG: rhodanese-like domain-containing protein [Verrucomicrobiota bacterium]
MTSSCSRLFALAVLLGICSCAQPAHQSPTPPPAAAKETPPAPRKPVRMNGRGKVSSISITDFFALQQTDQVLVYDARPAFFYHLGHIQGAISLPKENCDAAIMKREVEIKEALAAGKTIVVYCTNLLCPDARTVAIHLAGFGYSSSTLTGGWESWKEAGLPTE